MKISFITTVLNEENSITEFIRSLLQQSKKSKDIVIVDAGSIDATRNKIKKFKSIELVVKKGNRSTGRNLAISKSKGDIIVVSDAGCVLDTDFIKNITKPFEKGNIDVVSGYYYPIANSIFEKCLATYTCVMEDKLNPDKFLPSSRSIAFRKEAWEKVGGYPRDLDTCEDLVFAVRLKKKGFRFKFVKKAFVYWRQQKDPLSAFNQLFSYAKGDGQAFYIRPQVPLIFIRYLLGFSLLIYALSTTNLFLLLFLSTAILFYLVWSVLKNYRYIQHILAIIYLPMLQILSDIAVILGMSVGLAERMIKK